MLVYIFYIKYLTWFYFWTFGSFILVEIYLFLCKVIIIWRYFAILNAVSAGLGFLQFCNMNSFRTKFILGFSLFMGLSVPQYFNEVLLVTGHTPVHTKSVAVCLHHFLSFIFYILSMLGWVIPHRRIERYWTLSTLKFNWRLAQTKTNLLQILTLRC